MMEKNVYFKKFKWIQFLKILLLLFILSLWKLILGYEWPCEHWGPYKVTNHKQEEKIDYDLLLLQQSGLKNVPNHVVSASWTQSVSFVRCYYYKPTNSAALCCMESWNPIYLMALPTKGKDIVFRFIIEYSSLWDFSP
jgi:hypothetical protein